MDNLKDFQVEKVTKNQGLCNKFEFYRFLPKVEKFEIALAVIANWELSSELVMFAINDIGYCDSDNGFGISYRQDIDFPIKIRVPTDHILVFAESITDKEFSIHKIDYLKILSAYLKAKNESEHARIIKMHLIRSLLI